MFTGLIQSIGTVTGFREGLLTVEADEPLQLTEGGSVAVSGVCLTATRVGGRSFDAAVIDETLRRTSLAGLSAGDAVNLELAIRAGDPLGGHMVQGHVDAVGTVEEVSEERLGRVVRVGAPPHILRYVVEKGSIAVDGVSLTVAWLDDESLSVALIPETLEQTTLGSAAPGRAVNLEVDVLAKYVEKLVAKGASVA